MDLKKVIERGLELGLEEVEVYAKESNSKSICVEDEKLATLENKYITGYSIRGKYQGKMGYVYYEHLNEDNLDDVLKHLILNASLITSTEEEILFDGKAEYQDVENEQSDGANYSTKEKVDLLVNLEKKLKATDERIVKVAHNEYIEQSGTTKIVNSKGLNLSRESSLQGVVCGVFAVENGQGTNGYAESLNAKFKDIDESYLVKESTEFALNALNAHDAKTGKYEAILTKDTMSQLLSAFFPIFSSEVALKKMTKLEGKEGQKIFGGNVSIIEDPFHPNAIYKTAFDDEGYPCSKKAIVENGVFKTFLYNLKTAKALGKTSTGNGFKPGTASPVVVMPTILYLEPGKKSEEELISSIEDGIYITEVSGLHAGLDIISGDFNVQSSGRLIKNGKLSDAVTLFVVSANFFELMNSITEIGNNMEKVLTGIHSPSVKVSSIAISGK